METTESNVNSVNEIKAIPDASVEFDSNVTTIPTDKSDNLPDPLELIRKKQELEAELERINSALSSTASVNGSVMDVMSTTKNQMDYSGHAFTSPATPRKKKSLVAHSPANAWDPFTTSPKSTKNLGFDASSSFDLKSAYVQSKKEMYYAHCRNVKLAHLTRIKNNLPKKYYLGCLHSAIQTYYHSLIKLSGQSVSKSISGATIIVYHKNIVQASSNIIKKMTIGALGGLKYMSLSELKIEFKEFEDESEKASENDELTMDSKDNLPTHVDNFIKVSQFVRKCYGAGMPKPFDGRFFAIFIDDTKRAQEVEDAVLLLGGSGIRCEMKDGTPSGISHIVHDGKDFQKDKKFRCFHKLHYMVFFEHLQKEFDRLKDEAEECL